MISTTIPTRQRGEPLSPPTWIKPELAALVKAAPDGSDWLHEIKRYRSIGIVSLA